MRIRNIKNADTICLNSKYILKDYKEYKGHFNDYFHNNNRIELEIGSGKGDFLIAKALNNPNINFIGIEKYTSIIARIAKKLENINTPNLVFINCDASNIEEIFDREISIIYLNFSDPWPKSRHAKRRLTSEYFLNKYDSIFKSSKTILMKTDNITLFESSIISLNKCGYIIEDISLDLENTDKVYEETEYERKFKSKGVKINYLKATKIEKNLL